MSEEITLSPEQLSAFSALTAPTADPVISYVRQDTLVPVDVEDVAPGQVLAAFAVHQSGVVEPIMVAGRAIEQEKPGEYWWKIMLSDLLGVLEDMSGKQAHALRCVLDAFDPETGIILAKQSELAEIAGVSQKTMNVVMKLMMEHKLIAMQSPGAYAINPAFMSQGGGRRYRKLLIQYSRAEGTEGEGEGDVQIAAKEVLPVSQTS